MTVAVQGWAESVFEPVWPLNKLVRVKSPSCRVDGDALIAGVTFKHSDTEGTTTTLDLRNPASFTPDPTIAKPGAGNNYWREIVKGV
jgi:prophage tail gpP-like protein